jgi:hypothetical protein
LKTNIKDNCFDVMCTIDENRMMVTDTKDNNHSFRELTDHEVIPTFHIKGIKFNNKHFALEIELNHLYLLPCTDSDDKEANEPDAVNETIQECPPESLPIPLQELETPIEETDELSEFEVNTENIDEADVHLDNLTIYKIYEFLNTRIKESLIEDIRDVFTSKKIRSRLDFSEVIDDEETEE